MIGTRFRDLSVGIGTLGVSILLWVELSGNEARQMGMSAVTSRTFPQVAVTFLFALGLILTAKEGLALVRERVETREEVKGIPVRVWAMLGGTAGYLLLLRPLGFYLASGIYLLSTILYLGRGRNRLPALGITLVALLVFYLVFSVWLDLLLPRGRVF